MENESRYSTYREGIITDIVGTLKENEHTVESMRVKTGITWRTAKHHLQKLEDEGVVSSKHIGRVRIYYLNPEYQE